MSVPERGSLPKDAHYVVRLWPTVPMFLVGLTACGSGTRTGAVHDLRSLGDPCPVSVARILRVSEPVHDEVTVRYTSPGAISIETFDEHLQPIGRQSGVLSPPADGRDDFFVVPLSHGVVIRAARLTLKTTDGSRICVTEDAAG